MLNHEIPGQKRHWLEQNGSCYVTRHFCLIHCYKEAVYVVVRVSMVLYFAYLFLTFCRIGHIVCPWVGIILNIDKSKVAKVTCTCV